MMISEVTKVANELILKEIKNCNNKVFSNVTADNKDYLPEFFVDKYDS